VSKHQTKEPLTQRELDYFRGWVLECMNGDEDSECTLVRQILDILIPEAVAAAKGMK
jgi:hypothetical protein